MGSRDSSLLDSFREPEYTGENRCVPCTVINAALAVVLTLLASALGPVAALVVLTGSAASIYFRGYLIPGTPELTKRYLPDRVLALFGKAPEGPREGWERGGPVTVTDETAAATGDDGEVVRVTDTDEAVDTGEDPADDEPEFETVERIRDRRENAVDPVEFLLDIGVIERTDGVEELTFEPAFAERVAERVSSLDRDDVDAETLATMFGVGPDEVEIQDRSYPAVTVLRRVRKWPGDGAFLSDVASHLALAERTDRWLEVPAEQRLSILQSLRSFHASCPVCGGEIAATADTVESCCQAHEVVAIRCEACGEHILELDPEAVATPGEDTGITP
ncbi:hypothetical protein [Halorubrum sp. DTA46]|uniref:hypothetical protein n=1 Tax=Halorubrum sp. DTA46 TaxID=3402162 RepID=UPI003AB0B6D2